MFLFLLVPYFPRDLAISATDFSAGFSTAVNLPNDRQITPVTIALLLVFLALVLAPVPLVVVVVVVVDVSSFSCCCCCTSSLSLLPPPFLLFLLLLILHLLLVPVLPHVRISPRSIFSP